ncbi:MAG: hypothetical protein V1840_00935 [Candidatus Omnitrophota bacterium]
MKKYPFRLTLDIAGIVIRVNSEIDFSRFKDLHMVEDFQSEKGPPFDCRIFLQSGLPSLSRKKSFVFNPADNWKLFKTDKGILVEVGTPYRDGGCDEVILLNEDYSRGSVYKRNVVSLSRYFLDQFLLINLLSRRQGFNLHAAGLIWNNQGLVFSGRSGAGKSTLLKLFSGDSGTRTSLNDDRIIIRKIDSKWKIFGTPWHGDLPIVSPESAPLKAIYFIKHSSKNYIRYLSSAETCQALFQHSLLPYWDEYEMGLVLDSFALLMLDIPAYELGVVPDKRIVKFVTSRLK